MHRVVGHVADNVAIVEALGASRAAIVGHDWGSPIAAASAQLRPDRFAALGMLGVPFTPRSPIRPSVAFGQAGDDEEFYVSYFQEPGRAEAEIEPDLDGWLRGFVVALDSDGLDAPGWFSIPRGGQLRDRLPTDASLPGWLSPGQFDAHVQTLRRGGMRAPLNRYRNVDRDWEDMAAFASLPIEQPAIYIAGTADSSTAWLADDVEAQGEWLPALDGIHLLEGAGHWVHRERAGEVNALLSDWLDRVYR